MAQIGSAATRSWKPLCSGAERESEPLPENLAALGDAVVQNACALGFAQDLDADRLALTTESGTAPGEDYTLVFVVDHLLRRHHSSTPVVVKNVSTTRALDDVVARAAAELVETRVGEVHLSRALKQRIDQGRVAFGGEGNGGVILPAVHLGRDSLTGMALVLEALAQRPGVVKNRNQLLDVAYHDDVYVDDRTIDSHIKRIRRKFRAVDPVFDAIDTLYGVGYRFEDA